MAIVSAELKMYKSTVVSDASGNGARLSSSESVSGAAANLFPKVTPAERTAGSTRYRKAFFKVANDAGAGLLSPELFMTRNTPGADRLTFFPATQRDTQSAITGSERKYGGGFLQTTVAGGVTSFVCTVEDGATVVFVDGDKIRVSDRETLDGAGNEEFVTISGAPSVVGNNVTISFTPALVNNFLNTVTKINSVYAAPDPIKSTVTNWVESSAGGTYNESTYPVVVNQIGGVEQTWTLTFSSGTAFNIVGDTIGSVGAGSISGGAAPVNGAFAKPYFTLAAAGFGGTWLSGDTIVFQTHPAALPFWVRQVVPAAAAEAPANTAAFALIGESE